RDGKLLHVDRAGHPSVSSFFNTDDTKEEYNASEPVNDRKRWLDQFVHLMGHTGNYTREEAIAAIDKEGTLPDVLSFDPSKPAQYPNGRVFTDDVINYRIAFLTKNQCPPTGLKPHTDVLKDFPYLGTTNSKKYRRMKPVQRAETQGAPSETVSEPPRAEYPKMSAQTAAKTSAPKPECPTGYDLLHNPRLNKGTAFTQEERRAC